MAPRMVWTAVGQQPQQPQQEPQQEPQQRQQRRQQQQQQPQQQQQERAGRGGGGWHRAEHGGNGQGHQAAGSSNYRGAREEDSFAEEACEESRRWQAKSRKGGKGGPGPQHPATTGRHEGSAGNERERARRGSHGLKGKGGYVAGDYEDIDPGCCGGGGKGDSGQGVHEGFSQLHASVPTFVPHGGYGCGGGCGGYVDGMDQYWGWQPTAPAPAPVMEIILPPLWTEYFDTDGSAYYYNSKTGLSQWDRPPELDPPKPPGAEEPAGHGPDAKKHKDWPLGGGRRGDTAKREADSLEPAKSHDNDEGGGSGLIGVSAGGGGSGVRGGPAPAARGRRRGGGKPEDGGGTGKKKGEMSDFGPPGCNLFVFHLPDDWADDDLHEYFSPHGSIVSAKVMKELGSGRSRGFGFVSYEDRVSAATAIKKMQGYKVLGKRLKVEFKKGEHGGEVDDLDFGGLDHDTDGHQPSSKRNNSYPDDERLLGYLRAISAKNMVQSLKEEEEEEAEGGGGAKTGGEGEDGVDDQAVESAA